MSSSQAHVAGITFVDGLQDGILIVLLMKINTEKYRNYSTENMVEIALNIKFVHYNDHDTSITDYARASYTNIRHLVRTIAYRLKISRYVGLIL